MNDVYVLMRKGKDNRDIPVAVFAKKHEAEANSDMSTYVFGPIPLYGIKDITLPPVDIDIPGTGPEFIPIVDDKDDNRDITGFPDFYS